MTERDRGAKAHDDGRDSVAPPSSLATFRDALKGSTEDLTAIPIRRAVALLAIPTVLEMSMESVLAIVDIFVVSRLGDDAVATVGLTEAMLSPVYALAMGISAGATAIISRRTGERNKDGASEAAVQVLLLTLVAAAVLGVLGVAFSSRLLGWMGASDAVVALSSRYTALMLGGSFTILLLFVVNAIFRAVGDAAAAMRSLWLANLLNIALAPCLVFGVGPFPKLGVLGAGVAMTAGRGAGVAYQLVTLLRKKQLLDIGRRHLRWVPSVVREIVHLAIPAALQVGIETASWVGLVRIVATYGSIALSGYTIAMRIALFALLPSWGLSMAASALVGQNLGAKNIARARATVMTCARYNMLFLGPVSVLFALAPGLPIMLFTRDLGTAAVAEDCLRIVALGFIVFAFGMVCMQAFNGAGDTRTPMLVNLVSFWGCKLPLAWFLATVVGLGPRGAFMAITIAYAFQGIVAFLLFRRGRWEKQHV